MKDESKSEQQRAESRRKGARQEYTWIPEEVRADKCTQCHACEDVCPQQIPVSEWMVRVHEVLAQGRPYKECLPS